MQSDNKKENCDMQLIKGSIDYIVLYTNDVHCAIDRYDEFAAYRAELIFD